MPKKVAVSNTVTQIKPVLIYQIIETIKKYPVSKMCKIAKVSKSGYYKWLNNKNKISVQEILENIYIKEIFNRKDRVYGIRTIKMKLEQDYGIAMNRKKIVRIMKENNLTEYIFC